MNYVGKETRDEFCNDLRNGGRQDPAIRRILFFSLIALLPINVWQLYALIVGKIINPIVVKLFVSNLILYSIVSLFYLFDWKFQFIWKRRLQASEKQLK